MNSYEKRCLRRYGYKVDEVKPWREARGKEVAGIIFISKGLKPKHDSGYPFIEVYAFDSKSNLYHLGDYFDVLWFQLPNTYIDSLGKNVFRVFWHKPLYVDEYFIPVSTFVVDNKQRVR